MAVGGTGSMGRYQPDEGYGNDNPGKLMSRTEEAQPKTRDRPPALHYSEPKTKDSIVGNLNFDFPTMPTTAESSHSLYLLYTLNLYLVKCRQHTDRFLVDTSTKHHSRQQKTFER